MRTRRRFTRVAATLAAAAAVAVAVSVALAASHQAAGHQAVSHTVSGPDVQLAAWTVTRKADGSIKVTLREAADPAGLQSTLRANGVPASVTFTGQLNPACQPYAFTGSPSGPPRESGMTGDYILVINPSTLPSGAGLQIRASETSGAVDNLVVRIVKASPQCTGSAPGT